MCSSVLCSVRRCALTTSHPLHSHSRWPDSCNSRMELLIDGGLLDGVLPRKPLCLQPCGVSTESGSRDALGGSSISDDGGGSSTDNGGSRHPAEGNEDAAEVSSSDIAVDIKPLTGAQPREPAEPSHEEMGAAGVLSFLPANSNVYLFVAGVNKSWKAAWASSGRQPVTSLNEAVATRARTDQLFGLLARRHPSDEGAVRRLKDVLEDSSGIFYLTARAGNLDSLEAAAVRFASDWAKWKGVANSGVTGGAACSGSREIMQWARRQGCLWDDDVCALAAEHGHFALLRWLKDEAGCPLGAGMCSSAAKGGHLEILKWARSVGCRWDSLTCSAAAMGGHLEVLKWARCNGCPWDLKTCNSAASGGHLAILEWAVQQQKCPLQPCKCLEEAVKHGHLAVARWAHDKGGILTSQTCRLAAMGGSIDILEWLRSTEGKSQCPWNAQTCTYAAGKGQLAAIQWARANGCTWGKSTCSFAARGGHLAVLKWLREEGCPWDENTCSYAARGGYMEVLQWARQNGCPWDGRTIKSAARGGHTDLVKWAEEHGCQGDME